MRLSLGPLGASVIFILFSAIADLKAMPTLRDWKDYLQSQAPSVQTALFELSKVRPEIAADPGNFVLNRRAQSLYRQTLKYFLPRISKIDEWLELMNFRFAATTNWELFHRTEIDRSLERAFELSPHDLSWTKSLMITRENDHSDPFLLLESLEEIRRDRSLNDTDFHDYVVASENNPTELSRRVSQTHDEQTRSARNHATRLIASGMGRIAVRGFDFDRYSAETNPDYYARVGESHRKLLQDLIKAQKRALNLAPNCPKSVRKAK